MRLSRLLRIAIATVLGTLVVVISRRILPQRRAARHTDALRRTATTDRDQVFTPNELDGLPAPVRDYFENVLEEGQTYVDTVRFEQKGELRPGDADSAWKPFTATQYITTDPPGFFWDASVHLWPLVDLRVRDLYHDGTGSASVTLFELFQFGSDESNPELNEGELLRYLAEAVCYPTALLPGEGVTWEAVDDNAATATLEYGGVEATLTFHFSEDDEVKKVHADQRPRRVDDGYEQTPWTGRWYDYETRNGMRVPTAGEVIWHLPEGDIETWRGQLTDISYDEW